MVSKRGTAWCQLGANLPRNDVAGNDIAKDVFVHRFSDCKCLEKLSVSGEVCVCTEKMRTLMTRLWQRTE